MRAALSELRRSKISTRVRRATYADLAIASAPYIYVMSGTQPDIDRSGNVRNRLSGSYTGWGEAALAPGLGPSVRFQSVEYWQFPAVDPSGIFAAEFWVKFPMGVAQPNPSSIISLCSNPTAYPDVAWMARPSAGPTISDPSDLYFTAIGGSGTVEDDAGNAIDAIVGDTSLHVVYFVDGGGSQLPTILVNGSLITQADIPSNRYGDQTARQGAMYLNVGGTPGSYWKEGNFWISDLAMWVGAHPSVAWFQAHYARALTP